MPAYKESTVAGSTWRRAKRLIFNNSDDGPHTVQVDEEDVILIDGKQVKATAPGIQTVVNDLTVTFPLVNPTDNTVIPDAYGTYEQLYVLLFSLYWHMALTRDAAQSAEQPELPDETVL